ncbi:MAG: hypothetical protein CM1200mP26_07420 [Acidimicrobiales bacterium]|nr:MAG: hypothetical protein CM1200mP26_07420 [Acidimicrobiales bacterium]
MQRWFPRRWRGINRWGAAGGHGRKRFARNPANHAGRFGGPRDADGTELVTSDGRRIAEADAMHLPPSEPSKILCVPLNHVSRVEEFQVSLPVAPTYFQKPTSSLNAHRGSGATRAVPVAQLRGRDRHRDREKVPQCQPRGSGDYIVGYTIGNDYGLHDFRDTDAGSMLRVKGSDTLCPLGPGLVEGWDFRDKAIRRWSRRVSTGWHYQRDDLGHALPW